MSLIHSITILSWLTLLGFMVTAAWSVWRVLGIAILRRRTQGPSRRVSCRFEVTKEMVQSGRCPECGVSYAVAGIETPHMRLRLHARPASTIAACIHVGVLAGFMVAMTINMNSSDRWWSWTAVGSLLAASALVSAVLIAWMMVTHRRIERDVQSVYNSQAAAPIAPVQESDQ